MSSNTDAPQVEALAAAAAAAVNLSGVVVDDNNGEEEDNSGVKQEEEQQQEQNQDNEAQVQATAEVIAASAIATTPIITIKNTGRVSLLNEEDQQGKRRFFPRVKHLISNKEWEDFLSQILEYIEQAGAPNCPAASHKTDNAWYKAFDLVYTSVASEYSVPTGKNRYHKFKDKIVEVWVALEQQEGGPGQHHCRPQALGQLARHRNACAEAVTARNRPSTKISGEKSNTPNKSQKLTANGTPSSSSAAAHTALGNAAALAKLIASGSKRSFSTSFGGNHGGGGGGIASGIAIALGGGDNGSSSSPYWPNLKENTCLDTLPEPLRQLVHLKQLSREMSSKTSNRVTKKSIEQHGKTVVDTAYLIALQDYIKSLDNDADTEEDTTDAGNGGGDGGDNQDVAMDGGDGDEEKTADDAAPVVTPSTKKAYIRATSMAFLYRYASTVEEQRVLNDEYRKYSTKYIGQVSKNDDGSDDVVDVVVGDDSSSKKVNVDDVAASIKAEAAAATATAVAAAEITNVIPTSSTVTEVEATTAFSV